MELEFDSFSGRFGKTAARSAGQPCDWFGLHARLATAHAARRALLAGYVSPTPAYGSFDPSTAQALGALEEELMTVNLTALADGKSDAGKEMGVAAAQVPGQRGTK